MEGGMRLRHVTVTIAATLVMATFVGADIATATSSDSWVPSRRLQTTTTATCPTVQQGVDYTGNDIGNVAGTGATDCCAKCGLRAGCGAFTWTNYNGGTCWLKSGKGATTTSSGAVSAELVSATPTPTTTPTTTTTSCPTVEQGVDYTGNDIGNVGGIGAADCCTKCNQKSGCGAFTWSNYNGGTCWLKSSKGPTSFTTGVVSSVLIKGTPTPTPTPTTQAPTPTNLCPTIEQDVDFGGNDIGNVGGSGAADCCTKCSQRLGCAAFTWSSFNGGTCWLKSGKGATTRTTGVVSALVKQTVNGAIAGGATKTLTDFVGADGVVGNPVAYPSAGCVLPNYISKNGKMYVVAPNGATEQLMIKGVNWFGMETAATLPLGLLSNIQNGSTIYSIASFLARNNVNSVRLPICMDSLLRNIAPNKAQVNQNENRALVLDTYMNALKSIIKALAFRQISVVISIHTLTTSDYGNLWFNSQVSEQAFLQGIDLLTSNLCTNEYFNVLGLDLKNEPYGATWGDGNSATDFRAAATRIGNRMLAGCPNWLAFVQGTSEPKSWTSSVGKTYYFSDWWGAGVAKAKTLPVTLSIANKVVYAPHYYTPAVHPIDFFYGDAFAELPDAKLKENIRGTFDVMFGSLAKDPASPALVLGEFGGLYTKDLHPMKTIQRSVQYTIELMLQPGFAGGYMWSLNPESGYDWNPRNIKAFYQEGLVESSWRAANEPFLAALKPMDAMVGLKPLQCFK